mmetsp:Transcript_17793/g.37163  ORF Transcript_17793/g.37163 Transcript_17793/m.37163 type:complete len:381 (+) Transcript_17793:193-1335(+)
MRWLKIFLFSASPCLLPVVAVASTNPSSSREGYAYVSNIPIRALLGRGDGVNCCNYGFGAWSTTTKTTLTHHHRRRDKGLLRLNYLPLRQRWRVENSNSRSIVSFRLGASVHSENNDGTTALTTTTTKVIKRRKSWEESYALLCKYKDVHGHCNVPQSEKPLGTWVNSQRMEHARYLLQQQSKVHDHDDDEGGGKDDSTTKKGNSKKLKKTSMTAQRKKLLDEIGFVWDAMGHTWSTRYAELCEFRKINGHCVVPRSNGRLGAWVEKQRIEYKKYRLLQQQDENENDDGEGDENVGDDNNVSMVGRKQLFSKSKRMSFEDDANSLFSTLLQTGEYPVAVCRLLSDMMESNPSESGKGTHNNNNNDNIIINLRRCIIIVPL